jgi:hypothetical protein
MNEAFKIHLSMNVKKLLTKMLETVRCPPAYIGTYKASAKLRTSLLGFAKYFLSERRHFLTIFKEATCR